MVASKDLYAALINASVESLEAFFGGMKSAKDSTQKNKVVVDTVTLSLRQRGENYANCAGTYEALEDSYSGTIVYSNKELFRVILFYKNNY